MPNRPPPSPFHASRARRAQASVRSQEASAAGRSTGQEVHSSSIMATSTPMRSWKLTTPSGVKRSGEPSRWLRKVTPPASTVRRPPRLHTWKPPLSVRMGRCQPVKEWIPPSRSTTSIVPTGMNAGVSTTPCGVIRRPRRAWPRVARSWKERVMGCPPQGVLLLPSSWPRLNTRFETPGGSLRTKRSSGMGAFLFMSLNW